MSDSNGNGAVRQLTFLCPLCLFVAKINVDSRAVQSPQVTCDRISNVPIFVIAASAYLVALLIIHLLSPRLEPAKL